MGNLFSGHTPGDPKVSAATSAVFLGFEWMGAVGMWCVVFFVWLGGVWGQRVVVRRRERGRGKSRREGGKGDGYED